VSLIVLLEYSQSSTLTHITSINKSYLSFIIARSIISLGGLPPFTGFLPKLIIVQQLAHRSITLLLIPLLAGTFISLFFYIRVLLVSLVLSRVKQRYSAGAVLVNSTLLNFNLAGLLIPILCIIYMLSFKLYKLKTFKVF
jgi:NADH:ubiquinone oxidoreductase subunit 2 (subunit N)